MTLTRTALQLETSLRQRADMVGSTFRSPAAMREYLSESCRALIGKLVDLYGEDYWNTTQSVNTTANQAYTDLPADVFKVGYLRVTLDGVRDRIPLAGIDDLDTEVTPYQGWSSSLWPSFRVRGNRLLWSRVPTAVHAVTLDYVPNTIFRSSGGTAQASLSADTDTFDGVFGWDVWAVLHAAIKLRSDNGKDTAALETQLKAAELDFKTAAANRVATEPERVRDTWRKHA